MQVLTPLPTVELDPPTISMTFGVNDSPLAGRDGTHVCNDIHSIYFILSLMLFFPGHSFASRIAC